MLRRIFHLVLRITRLIGVAASVMVFCPIRPVKPPRVSKTGLNDAVLLNFIGVPIRIENRPGSGTEQAPPPSTSCACPAHFLFMLPFFVKMTNNNERVAAYTSEVRTRRHHSTPVRDTQHAGPPMKAATNFSPSPGKL